MAIPTPKVKWEYLHVTGFETLMPWLVGVALACVLTLFSPTEDVGDEGEEERECISYVVSTDIHYGLKSNR